MWPKAKNKDKNTVQYISQSVSNIYVYIKQNPNYYYYYFFLMSIIIKLVNHNFNNQDMSIHAQTLHSIRRCLTNKYIPENKTLTSILLKCLHCKYNF